MLRCGEPFAPQGVMLRFDRYLVDDSRALDLATAHHVDLQHSREPCAEVALFQSRRGRTLIDLDLSGRGRVEVWERWIPRRRPPRLEATLTDFIEMLECARLGAPRAFDLPSGHAGDHEYLTRACAREARIRGWVPVTAELLGRLVRARRRNAPSWMADRSLVIFAETPSLSGDAVVAMLRLAQRDTRPHVLIRTLTTGGSASQWSIAALSGYRAVVHEAVERFGSGCEPLASSADLRAEATARWALLLHDVTGGADRARRAIDLANVLVAREQSFEARALAETVPSEPRELAVRAEAIVAGLDERALARAGSELSGPRNHAGRVRGWEMVDDFVGVLQMCQDIEDEQIALARVGAFLRDRLQASSVAFVAREGSAPRVLARVGSEAAGMDLAVRSIETGLPIAPSRAEGPAESASPVRHAAEVIGAVWCRWSAGVPVAGQHASTLLGVAAAAAAPSVRLAISKMHPVARGANPVPELVGESPAMLAVRDAIVRAGASPFSVVVEGESGSGKELAARAIHARSVRRERRFSAINCAALVDELVEAELFGHVRGAFTGAFSDRRGVFEEASGGTLFLDEVAELGARVQAKLLRTLQEGEIRRLGEAVVRKVDVRVVAATNRPLAREVAAGSFRADLWYRLDVIRITLPPLRERLEDLPMLVSHLWQALAARTSSRATLSVAAIAALAAYDWPGNIRELQNVLASMLVATPRAGSIGPSALPSHIARAAALERSATLADARRQFEERFVRAALARAGGRTATAARDLGLSRQGLSKLMGRLGIAEARREAAPDANVQ